MATAKRCSLCTKELGQMFCTGCENYFCWKDFRAHREGMLTEIDKVIEERNLLQEQINTVEQHKEHQSPLLREIEQWRDNTIEKVKQIAANVHQQVIHLLNFRKTQINSEFRDFSNEIAHLKESENYVEKDLTRLTQRINDFKTALRQSTQPATIKLHTEQSNKIDWQRLIYVEEQKFQPRIEVVPVPSIPVREKLWCLNIHPRSLDYSINEQIHKGRVCDKCDNHSFQLQFLTVTCL
ncbi:hypothetical protein I4U23_026284 [Adineta vaga]|nr:hypothetical protein I4U23_026284 [Adineta vaga]